MTESGKHKLKVGLLLDSFHPSAWVAKVIDDIINCDYAEIKLIVLNQTTKDDPPKPRIHPSCDNRGNWLWNLYNWFDNKTSLIKDDPFVPVGVGEKLGQVSAVSVKPDQKKYTDYFPLDKINEIKSHELDVIFRFGFRIIRGKALKMAKYGIWGFHHGDSRFYRGGPPAFWELMHREKSIGSELQILTPRLNAGKVIYRSASKVTWYSMKETRCRCYWKTTNFAVRKLRDLYEMGEDALNEIHKGTEYHPYGAPLYKMPTTKRLLYYIGVQLSRMIRQVASKMYYRFQWFLAFKITDTEPGDDALYNYDYIVPPLDRTWADPFVIFFEKNYYIFLEEFPFKATKGHISVIRIDETGEWHEPVKILDREYHLSYPFVFQRDGEWYMIPESLGNRSVELYKAVKFPYTWEFVKELISDIRAVDATLHEQDGRLWMFVNSADGKTSLNEELCIFYADDLMGPWIPHKRNPVKSDVRSTRPAGKLFYWNGDLLRPAQDCSLRYGYAITINKIQELTTETFREKEIARIIPTWKKNMIGNHMLNRDGKLTVIDAYRRLRRF